MPAASTTQPSRAVQWEAGGWGLKPSSASVLLHGLQQAS